MKKSLKIKSIFFIIVTALTLRPSLIFAISEDYKIALEHYSSKKYDFTLKYLNKIITSDNLNEKANLLKSICLMETHKYNDALDLLTRLVVEYPQEGTFFFLKAFTEWRLNRFRSAYQSINNCLIYQPDNKFSYFLMAIVNYELDIHHEAKNNFDIANDISEELTPNHESKKRLIKNYRSLYLVQNRILESLTTIHEPENHKIWFYKAMFKTITNDNWSALQDFEKAISLNKKEELHHYYKSYTLAMVKKYDQAYACITDFATANSAKHNHNDLIHPLKKILDVKKVHAQEEGNVLMVAEKMPQFGSSPDMLIKFIDSNLKYPEQAMVDGIEGTVMVQFYVDKTGAIKNLSISKPLGGGCDMEVMRVMQIMPKWNPGIHKGQPVSVKYELPIRFKKKA